MLLCRERRDKSGPMWVTQYLETYTKYTYMLSRKMYINRKNFQEKICLWAKKNKSETILGSLFLAADQSVGGKLPETRSCRAWNILRKSKRNRTSHKVKGAYPGKRGAMQAGETCSTETCSTQNLRNVNNTKTGPLRFLHKCPGWDGPVAAHRPL